MSVTRKTTCYSIRLLIGLHIEPTAGYMVSGNAGICVEAYQTTLR